MKNLTKQTVTVVEKTTTHTIKLTGDDIVGHLGLSDLKRFSQEEVTFDVPSGGDFSGDSLDLNDHPITVTLVEKEVSRG